MNRFKRKLSALCLLTSVLCISAPAAEITVPTQSQLATVYRYPLTNATTFTIAGAGTNLATAALTLINSQPFPVKPGRGFAVHVEIVGTNSGTANVTPYFQFATPVTIAGTRITNWGSVYVPGTAVVQNGTTRVFGFSLMPPTTVDNVLIGRLAVVSNAHSASITLSPTNTFVGIGLIP